MSFKLIPIFDLSIADQQQQHEEDGPGTIKVSTNGANSHETVRHFTHIVDESFILILLLTTHGNLVIYYSTGGKSCRHKKVPIAGLFPKQKIPAAPTIVAITEDASAVIILLEDSHTILLIPFRSLMDVTWGRKLAPLVTKPVLFTIANPENENEGGDGELPEEPPPTNPQPTSALCFPSAQRTLLLFGNTAGSLFLVDLHLKRVSLRIDLLQSIRSLDVFIGGDGQKKLLVTQSNSTHDQLLLPLESNGMTIRECLSKIDPNEICVLEKQQYFPQTQSDFCVVDRPTNSLSFSSKSTQSENSTVQLDNLPMCATISQLLFTRHIVLLLTGQKQLFAHVRFFQPTFEHANFVPLPIENCSKQHILGLIPNSRTQQTHQQQRQCDENRVLVSEDQQLETCLLVTEEGIYMVKAEKTVHGLILDHLSAQLFTTDTFSSISNCLRTEPAQLCLSLLRSMLTHCPVQNQGAAVEIDGLLSLAFIYNVDSTKLMLLLQEYGQADLLIPFLTLRCEKNPNATALRQLLLNALLAKLARFSEPAAMGNGIGNMQQQQNKEMMNNNAELEAMELQLRQFLLKFDVSQQDVLHVLLRHHLWSCVSVLLMRNPQEHSPTVARHLLELAVWKAVPRIGGLLFCLSLLHWPSLDPYLPTLAVRIFNLVPALDVGQLRTVEGVADALVNRSVESAFSLKLAVSMRLLGLSKNMNMDIPVSTAKTHKFHSPLACGSNCALVLAENDCFSKGFPSGTTPMFWGDLAAGTARMMKEERPTTASSPLTAQNVAKRRKEEETPPRQKHLEATHPREQQPRVQQGEDGRNRKIRPNQFPPVAIPKALQLDEGIEISSVACGTEHILLLSTDGRLFSWGRNRFGQCGVGHDMAVPNLTEVRTDCTKIVGIFAGHYHSALITEGNEVWLWGWGLYGQLGNGRNESKFVPTKSDEFSALGPLKTICLGYAHTLALTEDGRVFGCGAMTHGQLGIAPTETEQNQQKMPLPIQLAFPKPIGQIASAYFHGIAIAGDGSGELFEWGECPQSLKMRMFLQKRLRAKEKMQQKPTQSTEAASPREEGQMEMEDQQTEAMPIPMDNAPSPSVSAKKPTEPIVASSEHLRIRRVHTWQGAPVKALSAGFNHSALITADGQLFTWGKALEMQLGHGNRKEQHEPTQLEEPKGARWAHVVCARNFTMALTVEGLLYVWGRNDRNQLGLGIAQKKQPIRRLLLKSDKGKTQRAVELPADCCVDRPTVLAALKVPAGGGMAGNGMPDERKVGELLAQADQHSLSALSRFLGRNPVGAFVAVQAHLMAGDLVPAVRTLVGLAHREGITIGEEEMGKQLCQDAANREIKEDSPRQVSVITRVINNETTQRRPSSGVRIGTLKTTSSSTSPSSKSTNEQQQTPPNATQEPSNNSGSPPKPRCVSVQLRSRAVRGGAQKMATPPSPQQQQQSATLGSSTSTMETSSNGNSSAAKAKLDRFHSLVDSVWALLRVHPIREVQTIALVELLHARFPVYNRLAADVQLCRLVEPFLAQQPNGTDSSAMGSTTPRRLMDFSLRERQAVLRSMPPPDINGRRYQALKARCEQLLAQDKFRFFADCQHFEKCMVESGPIRSELASARNRQRLCTRCVNSRRSSATRNEHKSVS